MLVLTREVGEKVVILVDRLLDRLEVPVEARARLGLASANVEVCLVRTKGAQARIGFEANELVGILRLETWDAAQLASKEGT